MGWEDGRGVLIAFTCFDPRPALSRIRRWGSYRRIVYPMPMRPSDEDEGVDGEGDKNI